MTRIVFVIAPDGFRDEELLHPREVLEAKGIETVVASTKKGTAVGKLGAKVEAEKEVKNVNCRDFDAVVFVGGNGVEKYKLYEDPDILKLASDFYKAGKLTTAICIAPRILAMASVLNGKRATCYPDPASIAMLKQRGAKYEETPVVRDGSVVTANGPQAARQFGEKIAGVLLEKTN